MVNFTFHFGGGIDLTDARYIIPTDLYEQMMALSVRKKAGEDVDGEIKAMIPLLYDRRSELGAIVTIGGQQVHVGCL